MNEVKPNVRYPLIVGLIIIAVSAAATAGYFQGVAVQKRRSAIQIANDDTFIALCGLRALEIPEQRDRWQLLLQATLDGATIALSDQCLKYPKSVERQHYDLLVEVERYLKQHGNGSDKHPGLGSAARVITNADAATRRLEAIHDTNEWNDSD